MPTSGAHRRVRRSSLVLLQLLVFVTYIFGPTSALGEDPAPEPTPTATESAAPDPSTEPTPAPTAEPTPAPSEPDPTASPDPTPAPSDPDPTPSPDPDPTASPDPDPTPAPAPGTRPYLVTFASGTDDARQLEILSGAGVTDENAIPQLSMRSVLLHEGEYVDELAALRANVDVVSVDLDRTRAVEAAPSDTSYADQWAMPQVGWDQLYGTVGIAGSATVAVLDTGVDAAHQDLDGVLLPGTSILDGSNGLSDPNGHGTWMAGIVAAETDNAFGVAGTAYAGVSILPVTVLGADGTGQDSDIIAGVVYAADAGADVILMSFSNPGYSPALQAAIDYAWAHGAVLVAATGNDGSGTATFPAGDRGVIGVTSTDSLDALAVGANYGPAAFMAAPGVDIATTSAGGSVATISGTSAAAAEVAGAAALLSANEPDLSNGVIVSRLARTADPAGDPAQTGNGRLNLARAMADASTDSVQPSGAAPIGDGGPLVGPYEAAAKAARFNPATASVSEGISGTSPITFTVVTNGAGTGTVSYATASSGANPATGGASCLSGVDYISTTGVLTFTAAGGGSEPKNIVVTICGDSTFEPNETFSVTLSNPLPATGTGMNLGTPSVATGTITNDDAANTAPVCQDVSITTNEDTLGSTAPMCTDADGDSLTYTVTAATTGVSGTNGTSTLTYDPNGQFEYLDDGELGSDAFTYTASDGDEDSNAAAVDVTIEGVNDAPVVTLDAGNDLDVDEGSTTTYLFSIFDAEGDTIAGVTVSCGAAGDPATAISFTDTSGQFDCTFPDGPDTSTISASATDDDGDTGAADTQDVDVINVAPTVVLSGDFSDVDEGSTRIYSYTVSDPGDDAATTTVVESCGANAVYTDTLAADSFTCTFPDGPATTTISVTADDGDPTNNIGSDSEDVDVINVAPTTPSLVSPANGTITNDSTPIFDWTDSSDAAGVNDTITYSIQADNSGCTFLSPEIDTAGLTLSTFTPGTALVDGTYCWRVRASDEDGGDSAYSATRNVTIDATAPNVAIIFPAHGGTYSEASWNAGCIPIMGDFCGTASDATAGLQMVQVSIFRGSTSMYWNGTSFSSATEVFFNVGNAGTWNMLFAFANFPSTGSYTIHAKATDLATNTSDAFATFQINRYTLDYLPPVDDSTNTNVVINTGKNGRVIPVKVRVFLEGVNQSSSQIAEGRLTISVNLVVCGSSAVVDGIENYADAGQSNAGTNEFRATSDHWIYNLDTGGLGLVTNKCYRLDVYLDGVRISTQEFAIFKPVK